MGHIYIYIRSSYIRMLIATLAALNQPLWRQSYLEVLTNGVLKSDYTPRLTSQSQNACPAAISR